MWLVIAKQSGPGEVDQTFECMACDAMILLKARMDNNV